MPGVIERPPLPAGPFVVVGLARSGVAAALALRSRGAEVLGCDAGSVADDVRARLEAAGVPVHAPAEGVDLLAPASTVVKSPGVPQDAPMIAAARRLGARVVGELEVGWRLLANDVIVVTGSNGKTTTAELIGHVHREAGLPVVVAGNVGTALTAVAGSIERDAVVVCEASSFQLEDTEALAPDAAVRAALASFGGVPHRLEEVADSGGVLYVNDSKATNVASAVVGIESFPGRVPAPPPAPATSCCCRRPPPPTTITARSRSAATTSGHSCRRDSRTSPTSSKGDRGRRRSEA